jgi:glycosyltransferase involved in cell wall biosynthesis
MPKVTIIVPSRNERFLNATIKDLLAKAEGDIEIIAILDGYWPNPALPNDPRLKQLHFGRARGMRPGINAAVAIAKGDYLLKCDAHTMWDQGFDKKLLADYHEDNWILTPRRFPLDPEAWAIETGNPKYPIDYEYLSYGLERPDDPECGFHGTPWTARREARKDIMLDTDMSSQGSAWFMRKKHFTRIGPLREDLFGCFYGESQEIGLVTQLQGGAMMRTKNTWYAHLRKGKTYGRGYALGPTGHKRGAGLMIRMCLLDQWPNQTRSLQSLVDEFAPVPTWPADLDKCFSDARAKFQALDAGVAV